MSDLIKVIKCKIFVTDHGTHYFKNLINFNEKIFIDVNHGLPMQKWNEKIMSQWYEFTEVWLMSNMHKEIYIETFKYKDEINRIFTIHNIEDIENINHNITELRGMLNNVNYHNNRINKLLICLKSMTGLSILFFMSSLYLIIECDEI